jgi:hypothetical protein
MRKIEAPLSPKPGVLPKVPVIKSPKKMIDSHVMAGLI